MTMLQSVTKRRSLASYLHQKESSDLVNPFCTRSLSSTVSNPRNRVPTSLYRQLLVWCRRYKDVPFNPLPPVTLLPPQVNPLALKRLLDFRSFIKNSMNVDETTRLSGTWSHPAHYAMYNENVIAKKDMITFLEISDANELRSIIRSIYWLNNRNTIASLSSATEDHGEDATKEQISLAFDAIKSCNQLSSSELDSRKSKREFSIQVRGGKISDGNENDEPNVRYHVGQVVTHANKWRGVIVGWAIKEDKNDGRHTSLTTKQYSLKEDGNSSKGNTGVETKKSNLQYTVLVDSNDASLLQTSSKIVLFESEEDLTPIEDPCLQRIENNLIKQYFTKFEGGYFVPNKMVSYVYPLDRYSECNFGVFQGTGTDKVEPKDSSSELTRSRLAITEGIRFISRGLVLSLSESMGQEQVNHDESMLLISSLISSAESMAVEVESNSDRAVFVSLAKLYAFYVKINSMLWTRHVNKQHKQNIEFSLGQVVKHKIYGFRGLVLAWDSKPRIDVSNWDGLAHIERPQEKPFYHVYPDVNDCISAFDGPRSFRYVCQDNLELSLNNDKPLDFEMTLDPDEWKWVGDSGSYIPSIEMRFLYAEDIGVHAILLEETFRKLRKMLSECMLGIKDGGKAGLFSIDDMFYQLKFGAGNLDDATIVQDFIRELWKESPNCDLRNQLDNGISELLEGKHDSALRQFSEIVESDPMYGEAWNKKATVHFMMGQIEDSIKSAKEALRIDGRNFQALAGIGLIEMDASHYDKAVESFRKCLAINPWMGSVSSRLSVCLRKIDNSSKLPYDADSWINIQDTEDPQEE